MVPRRPLDAGSVLHRQAFLRFGVCACRYGKYLLNSDYIMLPFGELERCQDFMFDTLGRDGRIFVRPDSPLKLFTGQTASRATFAADVEFMGFYEFPASALVVVSSPKQIVNEWRFVIAGGKVVAGCQNKRAGQLEYRPEYRSPCVRILPQKLRHSIYQPDPVWIADICQSAQGEFRLLEIGGFSFSDLYSCNKAAVVTAVSNMAAGVWQAAN